MARGQAAAEAIQQAPSATTNAVQVADAFQELQLIRELLDAANSRQYERALQVGMQLVVKYTLAVHAAACQQFVFVVADKTLGSCGCLQLHPREAACTTVTTANFCTLAKLLQLLRIGIDSSTP